MQGCAPGKSPSVGATPPSRIRRLRAASPVIPMRFEKTPSLSHPRRPNSQGGAVWRRCRTPSPVSGPGAGSATPPLEWPRRPAGSCPAESSRANQGRASAPVWSVAVPARISGSVPTGRGSDKAAAKWRSSRGSMSGSLHPVPRQHPVAGSCRPARPAGSDRHPSEQRRDGTRRASRRHVIRREDGPSGLWARAPSGPAHRPPTWPSLRVPNRGPPGPCQRRAPRRRDRMACHASTSAASAPPPPGSAKSTSARSAVVSGNVSRRHPATTSAARVATIISTSPSNCAARVGRT